MYVCMYVHRFSSPGTNYRSRTGGGSLGLGPQLCPLGERAPSRALWERQGFGSGASGPGSGPEGAHYSVETHAKEIACALFEKKFEQRAAREALMGAVGWFSSSSGLGAGRQLADVVTGLPTRLAHACSTYPWTYVTHVPIRLSISAQRLPRTSPRF